MKKLLIGSIVLMALMGCQKNEAPKEKSIKIDATRNTGIINDDPLVIPYDVTITQTMTDDSTRIFSSVIHVNPDETLFTYGVVQSDTKDIVCVLQAIAPSETIPVNTVLRMSCKVNDDAETLFTKAISRENKVFRITELSEDKK